MESYNFVNLHEVEVFYRVMKSFELTIKYKVIKIKNLIEYD